MDDPENSTDISEQVKFQQMQVLRAQQNAQAGASQQMGPQAIPGPAIPFAKKMSDIEQWGKTSIADLNKNINDSLNAMYADAAKNGIPVQKPVNVENVTDTQKANSILSAYGAAVNAAVIVKLNTDMSASLNSLRSQALKAGVPKASLPSIPNAQVSDAASANKIISSYQSSINNQLVIQMNNQLKETLNTLYKQGAAAGVKIPMPTVTNVKDANAANKIISNYENQINSQMASNFNKSVSSSFNEVYNSYVKAGGSGNKPPTVTYKDSKTANAALQSYVTMLNKTLAATPERQSAPAPLKTSSNNTTITKGATNPKTSPPPKQSVTYSPSKSTPSPVTIQADPNALNQYAMNSTQWAAYQRDMSNWNSQDAQPSPTMWMYNKGYAVEMPQINQYGWVQGAFVPNKTQSDEKARQDAIAASVRTGIDPSRTPGYAFQQELNDDNSAKFLKDKENNPDLTEYQWRQSHAGTDNGGIKLTSSVVPGSYVQPAVVGNDYNYGNKVANNGKGVDNKNPLSTAKIAAVKTTSQKIEELSHAPVSTPVVKAAGAAISKSTVDVNSKPIADTRRVANLNITETKKATVIPVSSGDVKLDKAVKNVSIEQKKIDKIANVQAIKNSNVGGLKISTVGETKESLQKQYTDKLSGNWKPANSGKAIDIDSLNLKNPADVEKYNQLINDINFTGAATDAGFNKAYEMFNKDNLRMNQAMENMSKESPNQISDAAYYNSGKYLGKEAAGIVWAAGEESQRLLAIADQSEVSKFLGSPIGYAVDKSGIMNTGVGKSIAENDIIQKIENNPVVKVPVDYAKGYNEHFISNSLGVIAGALLTKGAGMQVESVLASTDVAADAAAIKAAEIGGTSGKVMEGAAFVAKNSIRPAVTGMFAGQVTKAGKETFEQGDIAKDAKFMAQLAYEGALFGAGAREGIGSLKPGIKIADKIGLGDKIPETIRTPIETGKTYDKVTYGPHEAMEMIGFHGKVAEDSNKIAGAEQASSKPYSSEDHRTPESIAAARKSSGNEVARSRGINQLTKIDTHGYSAADISVVDDYHNGLLQLDEAKTILNNNGHSAYETSQLLKGKIPEETTHTRVSDGSKLDHAAIREIEGKPIAGGTATSYDFRSEKTKLAASAPIQATKIELSKNEKYIADRYNSGKIDLETAKLFLKDMGISRNRANDVLGIKNKVANPAVASNKGPWSSADNRTPESKALASKNDGNVIARSRVSNIQTKINTYGYSAKDIATVDDYLNGLLSSKETKEILMAGGHSEYEAGQLMKGKIPDADYTRVSDGAKSDSAAIREVVGKPIANGAAMSYDHRTEKMKSDAAKKTEPKKIELSKNEKWVFDRYKSGKIDIETAKNILTDAGISQKRANFILEERVAKEVVGKPIAGGAATSYDFRTDESIEAAKNGEKNTSYLARYRENSERTVKIDTKHYSSMDIAIVDDYQAGLMNLSEARTQLKANGHSESYINQLLKGKTGEATYRTAETARKENDSIRETIGKPIANGSATSYDYRTKEIIAKANREAPKKTRNAEVEKITGNQGYSVKDLSVIDDYNRGMLTKEEASAILKDSGLSTYDIDSAMKRTLTGKWDAFKEEIKDIPGEVFKDAKIVSEITERRVSDKSVGTIEKAEASTPTVKTDKFDEARKRANERTQKAMDGERGEMQTRSGEQSLMLKVEEVVKTEAEKSKHESKVIDDSTRRDKPRFEHEYVKASLEEETPYIYLGQRTENRNPVNKIPVMRNVISDHNKIDTIVKRSVPSISQVADLASVNPSMMHYTPPGEAIKPTIRGIVPPAAIIDTKIIQSIQVPNAIWSGQQTGITPVQKIDIGQTQAISAKTVPALTPIQSPHEIGVQEYKLMLESASAHKMINKLAFDPNLPVPTKKQSLKPNDDVKKIVNSHIDMSRMIRNDLLNATTFF